MKRFEKGNFELTNNIDLYFDNQNDLIKYVQNNEISEYLAEEVYNEQEELSKQGVATSAIGCYAKTVEELKKTATDAEYKEKKNNIMIRYSR